MITAALPCIDTALLPLDSNCADLERAGGKGANLSRLARAGYPVPGGFLITVDAYRWALQENGIFPQLLDRLAGARLDDPDDLERVSAELRGLFRVQMLSPELVQAILDAYRTLGAPPVAVRSSATAEDLPDLSFAGQQDTYLNVQGEEALLEAVVNCWGSLWTARAIGYRHRQQVDQNNLGLAVVVQAMVQSEAAGVLFTANPLTGLRTETVIDAAMGLGEALVSGKVEPDRYLVDRLTGRILEKKLGAKALLIRAKEGGGVETVMGVGPEMQALPDETILALANLGQQVAADFDSPQDIEWAWAGGKLYLLQSRPITSLFPLPERPGENDLHAYFSFGAVQGMLDPITPLGLDTLRMVIAGGAALFGAVRTEETQRVIFKAGERLWIDMTGLLRNPVGRKAVGVGLAWIEPSIKQNVELIWNDPRLVPGDTHLRFTTAAKLARFLVPVAGRVIKNWASPEARMALFRQQVDHTLATYQAQCDLVSGSPSEKLTRRIELLRSLRIFGPYLAHNLISALIAGMSQFVMLRSLSGQLDQKLGKGKKYRNLALEVTRGIPNNVTTEMDLALWDTARAIRSDPDSLRAFQEIEAAKLADDYLAGQLPARAMEVIGRFMANYGMRGVAEIDLGRSRWREEPIQVMQMLASYLQIENLNMAPDAVFARSARMGESAARELVEAARTVRGGWLKAWRMRFAARRVRALLGAREAPKFFAVRVLGMARKNLLESGREYAELGQIDQPDDLFFLKLKELEAFARGETADWKGLIAERRASYAREKDRRQIPRLLLSDGRAFYDGIAAPLTDAAGSLRGDPVSPGLVEGQVRIVLDPRGAQLVPGDILVCPGTDPAWTPLFLAAGGLVMEVGGMMTHGAVVAREYGIPAVVGVHQATTRLQTGQRVSVNGSTGEILLLEEGSQE